MLNTKSVLIEFIPATFSVNKQGKRGLKPYVAYDLNTLAKIYQAQVYTPTDIESNPDLNLDISFLNNYHTVYTTFSDGIKIEWYKFGIKLTNGDINELFCFELSDMIKCNESESEALDIKLPKYIDKAQELFDTNKNLSMYNNARHKQ